MKKTLLITTLVTLICISFAFRQSAAKYENLKVLPKNTDKKQMDSIMRHFSMSLGVRCNFCHVRNNDEQKSFNFASDENKNKNIARAMYKMTAKINKKYFKEDNDDKMEGGANRIAALSCYSCHHGKEHPDNRPPAPTMQPGAPAQGGGMQPK